MVGPSQHEGNVQHTGAVRAQVCLNQAQSGRVSSFRHGICWQIEDLSTRETCTIVVTECKCMGHQLVKIHLHNGGHAMVRLLKMIAQFCLQEGIATEEAGCAQAIHQQRICPNCGQVET